MSSPQQGSHGDDNSNSITPRIPISMPIWEATSSSNSQMAVEEQSVGQGQDYFIQITTAPSRQDPNAEYTACRKYRREYTAPNTSRHFELPELV
jgi:hypothetical protein